MLRTVPVSVLSSPSLGMLDGCGVLSPDEGCCDGVRLPRRLIVRRRDSSRDKGICEGGDWENVRTDAAVLGRSGEASPGAW